MKDVNGKWVGYGLGDTGPQVKLIQHRLLRAFPKNSQAVSLGVTESGTYDQATADAVKNVQPFLNPTQPATGVANYATQAALGAATPPPPPPPAYRPIWIYTAPGSGEAWWVGPAFELGEWCKSVLHLNHQPVNFPIGGYMGLMGGDPGLSYNDVIAAEGASLEWLLDNNPDVQKAMVARRANPNAAADVELWFSGYSQSADGMEDALVRLFGDGGKYALIRDRINGVIQFGNPSKRTTGIARKVRPEWLYALVHNLNHPNDFYAEATDEIRPLFYAEIVQANTSLSFFEHVTLIIIPVLLNLFAPFFGGLSALATPILATATGLPTGLVGSAVTAAGSTSEDVDKKLEQLLTVQGVLTNFPALIKLLGALPGIQAHGDFEPLVPAARDIVASFRR